MIKRLATRFNPVKAYFNTLMYANLILAAINLMLLVITIHPAFGVFFLVNWFCVYLCEYLLDAGRDIH